MSSVRTYHRISFTQNGVLETIKSNTDELEQIGIFKDGMLDDYGDDEAFNFDSSFTTLECPENGPAILECILSMNKVFVENGFFDSPLWNDKWKYGKRFYDVVGDSSNDDEECICYEEFKDADDLSDEDFKYKYGKEKKNGKIFIGWEPVKEDFPDWVHEHMLWKLPEGKTDTRGDGFDYHSEYSKEGCSPMWDMFNYLTGYLNSGESCGIGLIMEAYLAYILHTVEKEVDITGIDDKNEKNKKIAEYDAKVFAYPYIERKYQDEVEEDKDLDLDGEGDAPGVVESKEDA